ncbi:MAG TPA: RNA 2',3'-cyclic phosphodiesterase [Nitrospirae bacterium]|nr:RNA 2',3'-cyclic phosphodiesterase [Nitrospirota bacterium]
MRCFIAIEIDEEVKKAVQDLIDQLRSMGGDVRWVRPEGMHITLKFLGEIEDRLVNTIKNILKKIGENHSVFSLTLAGTGVFPDYSRPRVLWVGIRGNGELQSLYEDIEEAMLNLGFKKETRGFNPHVTLGRIKSLRELKETLACLRRYRGHNFGKIDVKGISLMKSTLKPTGAVYERIFTAPLKRRRDE